MKHKKLPSYEIKHKIPVRIAPEKQSYAMENFFISLGCSDEYLDELKELERSYERIRRIFWTVMIVLSVATGIAFGNLLTILF